MQQAIQSRQPQPGLIHHSDRGVQYACRDYVAMLEQSGMQVSMSRPGNPYDNAFAESFMKTLKSEEVDAGQYEDLADATGSIGRFIDDCYNMERLHSALGYRSPAEFETLITGEKPVETTAAGGNPKNQDSHSSLKPSASQFPQAPLPLTSGTIA